MRPFAPFSTYLFVAEAGRLLAKQNRGEDVQVDWKSLIQGLAAPAFRAGAGLFMLDKMGEIIQSIGEGDVTTLEKASRPVRRVGGEIVGGLLQPVTTPRELFADYGVYLEKINPELARLAREERKIRDVADKPFVGPLQRRIPILSQRLPELEVPFQAETPELEKTPAGRVQLGRQVGGIISRTRSVLSTEVQRLGLATRELTGVPLGEPEPNRLFNKHFAPLAEALLTPTIQSRLYQEIQAEPIQRLVLIELSKTPINKIGKLPPSVLERVPKELRNLNIRDIAFALAFRETKSPEVFRQIRFRRAFGRRTREALELVQPGRVP